MASDKEQKEEIIRLRLQVQNLHQAVNAMAIKLGIEPAPVAVMPTPPVIGPPPQYHLDVIRPRQ